MKKKFILSEEELTEIVKSKIDALTTSIVREVAARNNRNKMKFIKEGPTHCGYDEVDYGCGNNIGGRNDEVGYGCGGGNRPSPRRRSSTSTSCGYDEVGYGCGNNIGGGNIGGSCGSSSEIYSGGGC